MSDRKILLELEQLLDRVHQNAQSSRRLQGWERTIRWDVDGESFYWRSEAARLCFVSPVEDPDLQLACSKTVLSKILEGELPFFIGLWATGEISFYGNFADAFRLGYLFLNDRRGRRVLFLAHCFLNTNPRFPGGSAYRGSTEPLIRFLVDNGVGIVQMPCPEFRCLGLEKEFYGLLPEDELRADFRKLAEQVAEEIEAYSNHDYEVVGILGMNPSPSCGVEVTKGKGTMLGHDRDVSEKEGSGVFIEELRQCLKERNLTQIPLFGFRRLLPGESGVDERLAGLKKQFGL